MNVTTCILEFLYFVFPDHTVQWKPPGVDEEILFEDSRDQVQTAGADPAFFLGGSVPLRNGVTDW